MRSRVHGLLEPESLPCVGTQVKAGSHVVIWTACKRTHNQYETSCGILPHPRECLYASGSISSLSTGPDYQYQWFMTKGGRTECGFKKHDLQVV